MTILSKRSICKTEDIYYRYNLFCIYFSKSCNTLNLFKELPGRFNEDLSLTMYFINNYTHFLLCKACYDNVLILMKKLPMPFMVFQDILQSNQGQIISSKVN